jgi:RNA polymerase sigma factor (sigma-70 family)
MENLNLIKSVAWSFHQTTGVRMDELISEATLAYLEACRTHDPEKSKVTTWAYYHMRSRLIDFIKKEKRYRLILDAFDGDESQYERQNIHETGSMVKIQKSQSDQFLDEIHDLISCQFADPFDSPLNDIMKALPEQGKQLVKLILESPEDYSIYKPKKARGLIVKMLREKGWSWGMIWDQIRNLKIVLNEPQVYGII